MFICKAINPAIKVSLGAVINSMPFHSLTLAVLVSPSGGRVIAALRYCLRPFLASWQSRRFSGTSFSFISLVKPKCTTAVSKCPLSCKIDNDINEQTEPSALCNSFSKQAAQSNFFLLWFCLPSLDSINELMLSVRDPCPAECLPHFEHFYSDYDGGQSSIAVEQARNKLTAIMDSVIQLEALGLVSLSFLFKRFCMADCSAWVIHVFTQYC